MAEIKDKVNKAAHNTSQAPPIPPPSSAAINFSSLAMFSVSRGHFLLPQVFSEVGVLMDGSSHFSRSEISFPN
ncbi:hypothetical protein CCACVL1_25775 [Corchorus capsularis]|uniref:Uncharacterized protein n=1 Tax=Corchorus capsularis TaxID=210143 RepID=A0A1R3GH82_COCAP|nr:hypothetical protein CCACVL1_25775 [Corchorus capsularis]